MKKHIVSSLMLLSCSLSAVESRIEIRHREAGGVGYSTGYTSLDYFLMTHHDVEFLLDARAHIFNNGRGAGNFGLGFRCPIHDEKYLIGANAFYDIRQSNHLLANQVGAGFEWLGKYVDFRTNGYIPVGKKQNITYQKKDFAGFSGSHAYTSSRMKSSLPCIDAEVGTPLPHPFYFGLGGYYLFKQSKSSIGVGNAFGVKGRAEIDIGR
ncbi:MAG TPA: inverse autotransporter beta domain-containing protein, partial [Rhabdochlamydiaceae bacterium]|nr:inverse autotransporter beta domain-containing protein [Rhabdochlamydiaceae bacterium]